jgi:hypothetical protein
MFDLFVCCLSVFVFWSVLMCVCVCVCVCAGLAAQKPTPKLDEDAFVLLVSGPPRLAQARPSAIILPPSRSGSKSPRTQEAVRSVACFH